MKRSTTTLSLLMTLTFSGLTHASTFNRIPEDSGFSGFILGGATVTNFSSNTVSGNALAEVGHNSTNGLNESPSSETELSGMFTGELSYTFAEAGTQVYVGNELEDVVRYDLSTQFGVRQRLNMGGIVSFAYLSNGILPTYVYSDPFNTDSSDDTDREMNGVRLGWDNILESGINIKLTHKNIDIEDEKSGDSLVDQEMISFDEQRLLNRSGEVNQIAVSYSVALNKHHYIEPEITYTDTDKEGDAISNSGYGVTLSYLYMNGRFSVISQLSASHREYEEINPVWGRFDEGDSTVFGGSIVTSYAKPFSWENTSFVTSVAYGHADSNIEFYDSEILSFSTGLLYQF